MMMLLVLCPPVRWQQAERGVYQLDFGDGLCGAVAVDVGSVASFHGCRYPVEATSVETGMLGS